MKANTNTKTNNRKKLIPAAGALMISAAMLGASTYAWFTMSREVEVTNISMVATTPEDIQISLGAIGTEADKRETKTNGVSLANNTGVLFAEKGNADNGKVAKPENSWDWSDTADFSRYYAIGKLIPASSTNGENIFFTPDANGVGKTVKASGSYYVATNGVNDPSGASMSGYNDGKGTSGSGNAKATLHAYTGDNDEWASYNYSGSNGQAKTSGTGAYKKSTNWNVTNDDGYYVDIPVWLRTSSTEETKLTVKGYVAPRSSSYKQTNENEVLYKAVRVALLNPAQDSSGASISGTGLLPLADGFSGTTKSGSTPGLDANPFAAPSILNWYSGTNNSGAVEKSGTSIGQSAYGTPAEYKEQSFVTLNRGTGGEYGEATKVIVRVWLEGNDPDCWNETAGQDWYINLKFGTAGEMDDADIQGARKNDGDAKINTSGTARF